jgi:hypothetical protein
LAIFSPFWLFSPLQVPQKSGMTHDKKSFVAAKPSRENKAQILSLATFLIAKR